MPELASGVFPPMIERPAPTQERSRQALERLLLEGEKLLAENRFDDTGVAELARLAETSVGTFYRLLGDKDTLNRLLLQRFFSDMVARLEELTELRQWEGRTLEQFIRAMVAMLVSINAGRQGVLRALITRSSQDAQFRDRVHQINHLISQRTVAVLASKSAAIGHPNPTQAMMVVPPVLLGILNQHTLTGSLSFLSSAALEDELVRVALNYLA
ncbi:TetR/AcrR family transcriptional regulator [Janthinobacterium fluminis]|uniref:TetR/AcrR family transcriptional regulator n=1 Tax=Janthinobacterium fluminis TaxID=2987524 RepID=A0ABT5JX93_9BURK|nr:TetR/AcrR family transcriptional regulator [Janthinobacterium fluminis]MDC8757101.1 TetR/AcrR family transcriptional regulator [Janthinobacterium fluminis]